jgi:nicotinate-nucleotide--dimethylbenzimidazole phosphoribosyltransferase
MSESECASALATGWNAVKSGHDALLVGEMGIGNTTAAAAVAAALFGGTGTDWAGPGTGLDKAGVSRKAEVVDQALAFHGRTLADPIEALRRVGGRELAAICGAVAAARFLAIPVVLDGFVASAAAAPLYKADPGALDHAIAGHVSAEPGHKRLLQALNKEPLLALHMRLGEASGAAFAEAGVSGKI